MNQKPSSPYLVATLIATAVAAFAWAKADQPRGEFQNRKARILEERLAQLGPAQQALAKALAPLRDSLHLAIGEYASKVRSGAEPRSLGPERSRISSLRSRIAVLEAADPEVTLDLLGQLPPPPPMHPRHPRGFGGHAEDSIRSGHCPRNPPPPPEDGSP